MKNFRIWGKPPYKIAVVHGGPGAPGSIAPVAREMASTTGILEPLQTKDSVAKQIEELADVLKGHVELPVTLIGWSWGAILSYLTTARYPALVRKLILIGTPALEPESAPDLTQVWLDRLPEKERVKFLSLEDFVYGGVEGDKSASLGKFFRLIARAELYDPMPYKDETLEYQPDINMAVGLELHKLLASRKLLRLGKQITCPVVAIQGDYDPRPAAAVKEPLARVLKDFKFILLQKCGHYPWLERYARDEFFRVLRREMR